MQGVKIIKSEIEGVLANGGILHNNIRILNLAGNSMKSLNSLNMTELYNVEFLNISHNMIESLEGIEHLYKLQELLASNNRVSYIHSQHTASLESIKLIDLRNNFLSTLDSISTFQQNK